MKKILICILVLISLSASSRERQYIWPKGKMPDAQDGQIAAMLDVASDALFIPEDNREAYLEWFEKPDPAVSKGVCMILISGGAYGNCCDMPLIDMWHKELTSIGIQCVNLVYRTPWPEGIPFYQTAWEDGQRAVKVVRSEAAKRGFDPEKIGTISMSAGSHLALMLGTSSQTLAYERIDEIDDIPGHINWAIVHSPGYTTTDSEDGSLYPRQGYGVDVKVSSHFIFDEKTCPMCLLHGGDDIVSPNGSSLIYRELRKKHVPAELHIFPDKPHGAFGFERGVEFMTQMGYLGEVPEEVELAKRYSSDESRAEVKYEDIWPEGKIPDFQEHQCKPYIEWHFPKELKTRAIQIIFSGGNYEGNSPDGFEVAPARRYLNELGMTVVTMKYRTPRAKAPLAKHTTPWEDLQRAIRIVRSEAASYGLDPDRIGIMGSSAGGHLAMMGITSSRHNSYLPIDDIDKLSCKVQWGICIYPGYGLTDGLEQPNTTGGNDDSAILPPEFSFDLDTAPTLFIHGDADGWASMCSVKAWEKMRSMGIQGEVHTLATRNHCFQRYASPGTGSYTWMDRIREFLTEKQINIF